MLEKFKIRSQRRFRCITSHMEELYANESFDELEDTEQTVGFKYDPHGLLFDKRFGDMIDMSEVMYCDVAHCLYASGGIAQYAVNQLVLGIIQTTSTTLDDLDNFQSQMIFFKGKLTKTFFRDRVCIGIDRHMKCFASECMTALTVMSMFVHLVLGSSGKLVKECACFILLEKMCFYIRKATVEYATLAIDACRQHQKAFIELYPSCSKPKLHYLLHALRSWLNCGILLDCLGAESEHKDPKRVMHFAYKNCCSTAMSYYLNGFIAAIQRVETFMSTMLSGAVKVLDYKLNLGGQDVCITGYSLSILTPLGHFKKNDLIRWGSCIGIVEFFISVAFGATVRYFGVALQHQPVPGRPGVWLQGGGQTIICTASLSCGVSFIRDGTHIVPHVRDMHDDF